MKISIKFLSVVFSAFAICLILVFIALKSQVNMANKYLEDRKNKEKKVFDSFNQLKRDELKRIVSDYSIWDELAAFVTTEDTNWANYNVKSMINSFNLDAVWVYDTKEQLIYNIFKDLKYKNNFDLNVVKKLEKNDIAYFWKKNNDSFFLNYGASIRNTKDVSRKEKKYGYLIIGKKIDSLYLKELNDFSNGTISIEKEIARLNKNLIVDTLYDEMHNAIGFLTLDNNNSDINQIITTNKNLFNIVIICAIFLLILVFASFYLWVIAPLKKITSWLNFFHPNFDLSKHKKFTEFETISMVMHAQTQIQKKLNDEINEKQKAQEELQKHQQLLSSTIKSIDDIIFILDANLVFVEFLNEENADKFKLTSDVYIGKTIHDIGLPENILNKYLDAIEEINVSMRTEKFEYQLEAFDCVFSYSAKISPRLTNENKIAGFTIVCRDISIPQKTQIKKDTTQNLFEISFYNNSIAEIYIDVESNRIIEVNNNYLKLTEKTLQEIKDHVLWEFPYFTELFSGKMEFIELQASDCSYIFNKKFTFSSKRIVACDVYCNSFLSNNTRLIKLTIIPRFQKIK